MAEQKGKSLNSLASAASLHISKTKVWVNLNAGKTPALRLGCLALNDSYIFLDREGGSLAKSFSVVEGKYNFPDFTANCRKSFKNDHKFLVSSQVILSKSLIKQGYFLIEGNKFKIPLIYAFDMNDSNGIEMLIGANFLRSMKGGIRMECDEITIYKKVTRIKTSNQTEVAEVAITELGVSEEEFIEINESIYFNQEGSKAFLEQFKPVIDRLKHQGYIGEEPLKHWKKNDELCKLDIINPGTTIDPATGREIKGKERMVFNYKSLNDNTYKDQYSLPGGINHQESRRCKNILKLNLKSDSIKPWMMNQSLSYCVLSTQGRLEQMMVIAKEIKSCKHRGNIIKKIVSVNEEELKTKKGLRSFLGILNYARNHIPKLGILLRPLYEKTNAHEDKRLKSSDYELVRKIKEQVQNLLDLEIPPENAYIILETDGCMEGWRGIIKWKKSKGPKSALACQPKTTTDLTREKTLEFKSKKQEESLLNWKPLPNDWAATTSNLKEVQPNNLEENMYRYNRKGFLEDDDNSDDSIFIVDPGWDDYCLQELKLNRSVPLCPEAWRARI
ncbi:hypothetical protein Tco_0590996 [Tanacetum coccineum]